MTDKYEALNDTIDRAEETTGFERMCASAIRELIAERGDLKHQLKVAQDGWRCECSTDDACRFARERDELVAKVKQMEAQEPFAYFYHDAANAQSANPLLHSTFFAHASDRRQHYRNETPLYLAPGVSSEAKDAEIASLKVALRTTIRTYVVDDDAWDKEAETGRFVKRAIDAAIEGAKK